MDYTVSAQDRAVLRELATKQLEYANLPSNRQKVDNWYKHHDGGADRPMVHLELWTFAGEVIPQRLKCQGEFARQIEIELYSNFLNQELFNDDRTTPDYFQLNYDTNFELFGINVEIEQALDSVGNASIGHHFKAVIEDLEEDFHKIKPSRFGVDLDTTKIKHELLNDVFGDILPVKIGMDCLYSVPTQMLVHFMSIESMMYSLYDYPDLFKLMMNRISDDVLEYFRLLENNGLIYPTTAYEKLGQGSWCFNRELPDETIMKTRPLTTKDVWGFMDSQETVGISPEMFEEFIFPCYKKISEQFGLLSYGCCEQVDPIWDNCLSKLENLRKISISPWCQEEIMGEKLRGSKVIYHRKPSPNYLGVDKTLDEDAVRKHIRKSLKAAEGCVMEITQRDVYTIHNNIDKAKRYVDIIYDEINKNWK